MYASCYLQLLSVSNVTVAALVVATILSRHHTEAVHVDRNSGTTCTDLPAPYRLAASNLLQVRTSLSDSESIHGHTRPAHLFGPYGIRSRTEPGSELGSKLVSIVTEPVPSLHSKHHRSEHVLPPHLVALGLSLLGSQQKLDSLVVNSMTTNVTYDGVPLVIRAMSKTRLSFVTVDNSNDRALESLRNSSTSGVLRVLDLAGNDALLVLAAYKSIPDRLQAVVVEPSPSKYFLLRWNMWLNHIPLLKLAAAESSTPGIVALHRTMAKSDEVTEAMCTMPDAQACDCQTNVDPEQCTRVRGISPASLLNAFRSEPIELISMKCGGCEAYTLPLMLDITTKTPARFRRLVGQLHAPSRELSDMACQIDNGVNFVRTCATSDGGLISEPLRCGETWLPCEK